MNFTLNILFSIWVLFFSVRMIYFTYKEPSDWSSTNLKGYLGGASMAVLSIMSLVGQFNLFNTFTEILLRIFNRASVTTGLQIAIFSAVICAFLLVSYFRPDKVIVRFEVHKANAFMKFKAISNAILFYSATAIILLYLIWKKFN